MTIYVGQDQNRAESVGANDTDSSLVHWFTSSLMNQCASVEVTTEGCRFWIIDLQNLKPQERQV